VPIVILAVLGLAEIVVGALAFRWVRRASDESPGVRLSIARGVALFLGAVLGLASWPLTGALSYPYAASREVGRVAGLPFMAAYFDAAGRDFVGPLTLPAVLGNAVFWALLPQLVLAGYLLAHRRWIQRR
jgi:hypothetical protein